LPVKLWKGGERHYANGKCHSHLGSPNMTTVKGFRSRTSSYPRVASYICRQKGEHIDIAEISEFLSKLGAHERAVIVVSGDVAGDPSPLPARESAV
jgi:hypothetical protein